MGLIEIYNKMPLEDVIGLCEENDEVLLIEGGKITNIIEDEEDYYV